MLDLELFKCICKELFAEPGWACDDWPDHEGLRLSVNIHGELDLLALHKFMNRLQDFPNVLHAKLRTWESGTSEDCVSGPELCVWVKYED